MASSSRRGRPAGALLRGVAAAVLLALAGLAPVVAAAGPVVAIGDGRGGSVSAEAAALLARAGARGQLPVIVGLEMAFAAEGTLAAADAAAQRARIATAQEALLALLAAPAGVKRYATIPFMALVADPADLARILAAPGVASVVEDVPVPPALADSVPLIKAPAVWRLGNRGSDRVVAVLDTGVQLDHQAFAGRIRAEACHSTRVAGVSRSLCPGGAQVSFVPGAGADCPLSISGCGHGTHVAGIVASNLGGARGVAPEAGLIAVKVFARFDDPVDCASAGGAPCALSYTSDQMSGLERIAELAGSHAIAAVNMSIAGGAYPSACDTHPLKATIDNLLSVGIVTVISSGNAGWNGYVSAPGCISSAVTVGATTKADAVADFSNHAWMVDLMAPGADITAPVLSRRTGATGTKSGTSMAAPHVAGAWALLRQAREGASPREILRALECTGEPVARADITLQRIDVAAARRQLLKLSIKRRWLFRTDADLLAWTAPTGRWVRFGAFLRVAASDAATIHQALTRFCGADLEVTAEMRRVTTEADRYGASGLTLFATFYPDGTMRGLMFMVGLHYDSGNGYATIVAMDRLDLVQGWPSPPYLCHNTNVPAFRPGEFNTLRVVSEGGLHRLFVNGEEACRATRTDYTAGELGPFMWANSLEPGNILDVEVIRARTLGPEAGAAGP